MTDEERCSLPRSKAEARELGAKLYFTGDPCKHGHLAARYVSGSNCLECHNAGNVRHYTKYRQYDRRGFWAKKAVHGARARALKAAVPCTISDDDIRPLCVNECPALGITLLYFNDKVHCDQSASLDRIIPELGYVAGNVVVISSKANRLKSNGTPRELQDVATWAERVTNEHPIMLAHSMEHE